MKPTATNSQNVEKSTLPNGLRVITEQMDHVRSVAVGVWVDSGSRHEPVAENGISHFAEHMVFKGTESRSAEEIACSVDAIGGHLDAFTTKETIAFTAKVLDDHLPVALDVVSDLVLHPVFREEDIVKEKGVVLEELKMDEDNPDYLLQETFAHGFWKNHSLGRPIIGTKQTISSFQREQLRGFFRRTFHPENLVITAAGNLRHKQLVKLVDERFSGLEKQTCEKPNSVPRPKAAILLRDKPSLEQIHLCLGVPAHRMADPRRYAGFVLNAVLGGGVSSRLFLKIREKEGLAYAVFSDLNLYSDSGCMSVYAGTSLDALQRVVEHIMAEFRDLKENLVPEQELRRAKDHLKGSLMLSLEATSSRMANLARQERYFERFLSLDEVSERVEQVTADQLREIANDWFQQQRIAIALLGRLNGFKLGRESLAC